MLTTFSLKTGGLNLKLPSFLLGLCYFSIFGPPWPPPGPILPRFWKVRGSILEVFGAHFLLNFHVLGTHVFNNVTSMFKPFLLVLDGLVGLREAQRIIIFISTIFG